MYRTKEEAKQTNCAILYLGALIAATKAATLDFKCTADSCMQWMGHPRKKGVGYCGLAHQPMDESFVNVALHGHGVCLHSSFKSIHKKEEKDGKTYNVTESICLYCDEVFDITTTKGEQADANDDSGAIETRAGSIADSKD